jgi:hypothetical protein
VVIFGEKEIIGEKLLRTGRCEMSTMNLLARAAGPGAVFLILFFYPAFGQQAIDETRPVDPECVVTVDNLSGSVTIAGWDRDEIHITGTLGKGAERLDIGGDRKRIDIRVVIPEGSKHVEESRLDIHVPSNASIEASTVSADVLVSDVRGRLDVSTVSGNVGLSGEPREASVKSVSGSVDLEAASPDLEVESVSGEITITKARGDVHVNTVSGGVRLEESITEEIAINSFSGDVHVDTDPTDRASCRIDNHSGDVTILLPSSVDAEFDVDTFSGDITSDFGTEGMSSSEHGPGHELHLVTGSGGAKIEVATFSGDVVFRKR